MFIERFQREARATAKLNHHNIIAGIGVGEAGGYNYFAMEYIEGETLNARLKREGAMAERDVLELGVAMASALAHAHSAGIIHRDVKPENILIANDGTPKLADLGLAKAENAEDNSLTQSGSAVGTPHYIAPEQASGLPLDGRADSYALGCTLYHAATGHTPFNGATPAVLMVKHINERMPHPQTLRPELSDEFCAILSHLVAREPQDRYARLDQAVEDMSALLSGGTPATKALPSAKINFLSNPAQGGSAPKIHAEKSVTRRLAPVGARVESGSSTSGRHSTRSVRAASKSAMPLYALGGGALVLALGGYLIFGGAPEKPKPIAAAAPTIPAAPPAVVQNTPPPPIPAAVPKVAPPPVVEAPRPAVVQTRPATPPAPPVTPRTDTGSSLAPTVAVAASLAPAKPVAATQLPLPRADAIPLFDGKSLDGWNLAAPAWSVADGVMVGRGAAGNASLQRYRILPVDFDLQLDTTFENGFHFGWSSQLNGTTKSNYLNLNNDMSLTLSEYEIEARELARADHNIPFGAHTFRVIVQGGRVVVAVDGATVIQSDKVLRSDNQRDLYIFAHNDGTLKIRSITAADASHATIAISESTLAPAPTVMEVVKPDPEVESRWAYAQFEEQFIGALRKLDAKASAESLAAAEKNERFKAFVAELKDDRQLLGWLNDVFVAELDGAKKLKDVDTFEVRLLRGDPLRVGKHGQFQLINADKGVLEIGSGGMSFMKPVAQLKLETRQSLAGMGFASDATAATLARRAFLALLTVQPADSKTFAAAIAAVDTLRKADGAAASASCLERWLKSLQAGADSEAAQRRRGRRKGFEHPDLAHYERVGQALHQYSSDYRTTLFYRHTLPAIAALAK